MWNTQCTLVVAILLVATGVLVQASTEHCVVPSEESVCTCNVTCHTLDVYLSSPGDYFKSGVTFRFLPGVHQVHNTFSGSNIQGLSFVKDINSHSNVTLILNIDILSPSSNWFNLQNSSSISFSGLVIHMNIGYNVSGFMFKLTDVDNVRFSGLHLFYNGSLFFGGGGGGMNIAGGHNISMCHITFESYGAYLLYADSTDSLVLEYCSVQRSRVVVGCTSIGKSNFCYSEDCFFCPPSDSSLTINNSLFRNTLGYVNCSNCTINLENSYLKKVSAIPTYLPEQYYSLNTPGTLS